MSRRRSGAAGGATKGVAGLALLAALGAAGPPAAADAGERGPEIELRVDVTGTTVRVDDRALGVGIGAGLRLVWHVSGYAGVYAGYGRRELADDDDDDDASPTLEHEGYALGLQVRWSEPYACIAFRLAAGVTHDSVTVIADPAPEDARRGNGWEVGAAILVPLAAGWTLAPGLRYRHLSGVSSSTDERFDDTPGLAMIEVGALWAF